MKAISIIEKLIKQYENEYCTEDCEECSSYCGCAVLEAKNYLEEELGFGEDE